MSGRPWLVLVLLAACDTRAQPPSASASGGVAVPADPERMAKEHESCGTTVHCAAPLRCLDQACRRTDRSVLGDYQAARAELIRDSGDLDGALKTYELAAKHYKDEGLVVPADIDCAYGSAAAGSPAQAELAARLLHRCILAAPAGSGLRARAMSRIASLEEAGFDPAHLGGAELADKYVSPDRAAAPRTETLQVAVTASPEPDAKGWAGVKAAIEGARAPLVACWEASYKATKTEKLAVAVPMKSSFHQEFDDEPGYYKLAIQKDPAAANDHEKCVRDAVTEAIKGVKNPGRWESSVTVSVQ